MLSIKLKPHRKAQHSTPPALKLNVQRLKITECRLPLLYTCALRLHHSHPALPLVLLLLHAGLPPLVSARTPQQQPLPAGTVA